MTGNTEPMNELEPIEVGNCPTCGHFPTQAIATDIEKADRTKGTVYRALDRKPGPQTVGSKP